MARHKGGWLERIGAQADTTCPQRCRRGIFVEPKSSTLTWPAAILSHPMGEEHSPVGAAYSNDVAPERSLIRFETVIYKYASPAGLKNPCSSVVKIQTPLG